MPTIPVISSADQFVNPAPQSSASLHQTLVTPKSSSTALHIHGDLEQRLTRMENAIHAAQGIK